MLVRNLAWTVPGNIVGGGLLVGLLYGWAARPVALREARVASIEVVGAEVVAGEPVPA
jgi:hypothetical protein